MKKLQNIHPVLFALFPAASIVADHIEFISFNITVLLLTLAILFGSGCALLLFGKLWQDKSKAAVFTSFALILFFSYGHVFDYLTKVKKFNFIQHRHLFAGWLILYFLTFIVLHRTKRPLTLMHQWLTVVGIILILFSSASIINYQHSLPPAWQPKPILNDQTAQANETLPDIYYIILDAYANEASLQTFYGFENDEFLTNLAEKGFFIAKDSRSNYALTSLSLSSSLNLAYINEITTHVGEESVSISIPKQIIENNNVMQYLKNSGYQLIFMGSGYGVSQSNQLADVTIKCGLVDETVGRFIATSLLRAPADRFRLVEQDDRQRRLCMLHSLETLPNDSDLASPKFVFAHVPSPHWPFLFDAEGNPVIMENLNQQQLKDGYLGQLIYLNGRVEQIVDTILQNSSQDPIIIIQSDHGPAFNSNMEIPSEQLYLERMRILNAYYFPEEAQTELYPSITPVNSFRVLFNHLFATNLPLLDDNSYFSNYERPYKLTNVTEIILSQ